MAIAGELQRSAFYMALGEFMEQYRGTTILSVRRADRVVIGGDGQVSLGNTILKGNARKVRRLYRDQVLAGFAGGTADAFTLFERFEGKLEKHQGQLLRAAVELAKDWRTDRILRRLEAMLAVADAQASLIISGNGDVVEPEAGGKLSRNWTSILSDRVTPSAPWLLHSEIAGVECRFLMLIFSVKLRRRIF